MKMTFTAKVVVEIGNDPELELLFKHLEPEPTLKHLATLLEEDKCNIEMVQSWDGSGEPTLIITEK